MKRFQKHSSTGLVFLRNIIPVLVGAGILLFFWISISTLQYSHRTEQISILENSINRSITQCYALEGSYPPNLEYLTTHYGLTYDEADFFVDYQYIASNLRPDVTVIAR